MTIGQKIKDLREKRGLTLEEVGNKVGVGKSTVRKWENDIIDMKRDKIAKLAETLGCSPLYLLGYEIDEEQLDNYSSDLKDIVNDDMDENTKKFIELYSQLNDEQKKLIDNMLTALSSKQ